MMKKKFKKLRLVSAMTLIEMIAAMIVLSIAVYSLVAVLQDVTSNVGFSEDIADANFYAQEMMEKAMSKDFVAVSSLTNYTRGSFYVNITVVGCTLSGNTWVVDPANTTYKVVTVTASRPGTSAKAEMTTLRAADL